MAVDPNIVSTLNRALGALKDGVPHPVPTGAIAALVDIAEPGLHLKIDIAASNEIGAPLVILSSIPDDTILLAGLTKRQKQVAELVLEGRSNRQIAVALGISVATVKDHVHAILHRLDLPSRSALIAASRSLFAN